MTYEVLAEVRWVAVAVAAFAYYVLGAVWFTPLFGKAWDRSLGYDRSQAPRFTPDYYLVPLASAVTATLVLGMLLAALAPASFGEALSVGALVGLAVAAISVNNALTPHTPHPYLFGAVTGGYHLVGLTVAAAVIDLLSR